MTNTQSKEDIIERIAALHTTLKIQNVFKKEHGLPHSTSDWTERYIAHMLSISGDLHDYQLQAIEQMVQNSVNAERAKIAAHMADEHPAEQEEGNV